MATFLDDNDCQECTTVLAELENIDDEADKFGKPLEFLHFHHRNRRFDSTKIDAQLKLPLIDTSRWPILIDFLTGIDFVKINDDETAKKYGIVHTPALIYFRKRTPMVYDGKSADFHLTTIGFLMGVSPNPLPILRPHAPALIYWSIYHACLTKMKCEWNATSKMQLIAFLPSFFAQTTLMCWYLSRGHPNDDVVVYYAVLSQTAINHLSYTSLSSQVISTVNVCHCQSKWF